jgi:thiamine pyrophosphokinase
MTTIILANGNFPKHPFPLGKLANASNIICCDGSVNELDKKGIQPLAIVGDLDSLSSDLKHKYSDRVFFNGDQNSNDLTKAVRWAFSNGYKKVEILGATGIREDHTIGNISLLTSYVTMGMEVEMFTDYGMFTPLLRTTRFPSHKGQAVSIFSQLNSVRVTTHNLEFPIENWELPELWMGTLNRSLGEWFEVELSSGSLIVFREY